jgi:hypothetical protein
MDTKIGSFFGQALQHVGELFQESNAGAALPGGQWQGGDRVEQEQDGGLHDFLLAHTHETAAVQARPAGPSASVTGQYNAGPHQTYVIKFDRPVSMQEAEKFLFRSGSLPPQNKAGGEYTDDNPERCVQLGAAGQKKGGKTQEWVLSMPESDHNAYDKLNPGIEDQLYAAPPTAIPGWVGPGTRDFVNTGKVPTPGDQRFAQVKNHYPPPNEQVTVWREGGALFRYDGKTGRLDSVREKQGRDMGGYNKSIENYVLGQGLSIDEAIARTGKDFDQYFKDTVLKLVIGSMG